MSLVFKWKIELFFIFFSIDNQPHADAGNDVVIHLPKNYVILNGNGSYDDNDDTITYHWWNKDPQRTLDLRVCYNVMLFESLIPGKGAVQWSVLL